MSSMYKIPPYMPEGFDVKPIDVMYSMPNYHGSSQQESSAVCNGLPEELNDPVKTIERKQQCLIKSIKDLGSTLEALLQEMGKIEGPSAPKKSKLDESAAPVPEDTAKSGNKKDKDAKKEARKAARTEAKNKVASGGSSTPSKSSDADPGKPWIIHEEKRSTITGQSLTACLPSALTDFDLEKVEDLSLTATEADRPWIEALSHVGITKNVAFRGDVSNSCPNPTTTVTVSFGEKFSATASGTPLTCRISVDLVLSGKASSDEVIREASQFLSQFDALGSQFRFGIADIVAKAVLIGKSPLALPSNVELWSKRMETVI
ncbi:hypothetical protein OESDEN_15830 [Oesophagostomum dentatum]|uniref:Uncharacterized protein n=1 Tax=Oesophagostomum dentatum TaxID=61180 RepID=A0A0B1SKN9_OESDE|nr:hypothetical protein OESDEN_15830 [Oesophagostomum dentatum]